jgi:hypothetical protein
MNAPLSRAVISLSLLTLGACCAASCGARTQGAERATRPATEDVVTVDARDAVTVDVASGCGSDRDCAPGERCLGAPGCGAPWACTPVVGCLRDLTLYCGCDGRTRAGSSDCPGRPYAQRGPCNPGLCAAPDARAEGDCAREMGYVVGRLQQLPPADRLRVCWGGLQPRHAHRSRVHRRPRLLHAGVSRRSSPGA